MNNSLSAATFQTETVIIIGAGASGLMAARELSVAGVRVIVLEAGNEPGGRIRTFREEGFALPVEAGAEFVHGDLPLTLQLLGSAGIPFHPVKGKMINVRKGKWLGKGDIPQGWGQLMEKMQELVEDMPLSVFLSTRFPGEKYAGLRDSARRYAQGFDLADIHVASTHALYEEWSQEDHEQYRIEGGYGRLVAWLAEECRKKGCLIHLSSPVEKITWGKGRVIVTTAGGQLFTGSKAILTVSLGILQESLALLNKDTAIGRTGEPASGKEGNGNQGNGNVGNRQPGAIRFEPAIDDHLQAAGRMGYGTVTKILLQFSTAFWQKKDKKIGFILSDEAIPTWWTQFPDDNPLLTAWVPGAMVNQDAITVNQDAIMERCLSSLASIFDEDAAMLKRQLTGIKIVDWLAEPFIRGGYSFEAMDNPVARHLLNQPIQDTLYFAGEALHEGEAPGTVEAALDSGKKVAEKIRHTDRVMP